MDDSARSQYLRLQAMVFSLYTANGIKIEKLTSTTSEELEASLEAAFSDLSTNEIDVIVRQFSCIGYSSALLTALFLWPNKFSAQEVVDAVYFINADLTPRLKRLQEIIGNPPF